MKINDENITSTCNSVKNTDYNIGKIIAFSYR